MWHLGFGIRCCNHPIGRREVVSVLSQFAFDFTSWFRIRTKMLQIVVIFNVLLSLLCLYVAWQVWNLRRALAATTAALINAERNTHGLLYGAPRAISQGQLGVRGLRERYQQLELQVQKVRQILALLTLIQNLWLLGFRRSVRNSSASSEGTSASRRLRRLQRSRRSRRGWSLFIILSLKMAAPL